MVMTVIGTPARRYSMKVTFTPRCRAISATIRLATEPSSVRLPASVEETRQLEVDVDNHHAEQERQRPQINRGKGLLLADRSGEDQHRRAHHGNRRPVHPQAGNLPDSDAHVNEEDNDAVDCLGEVHGGSRGLVGRSQLLVKGENCSAKGSR
jgi:hypothetical protein